MAELGQDMLITFCFFWFIFSGFLFKNFLILLEFSVLMTW